MDFRKKSFILLIQMICSLILVTLTMSLKVLNPVKIIVFKTEKSINILTSSLLSCDQEWVMASLESGDWVDEEPYEMTDFSPAVKALR